jgi:hypothetical protein
MVSLRVLCRGIWYCWYVDLHLEMTAHEHETKLYSAMSGICKIPTVATLFGAR